MLSAACCPPGVVAPSHHLPEHLGSGRGSMAWFRVRGLPCLASPRGPGKPCPPPTRVPAPPVSTSPKCGRDTTHLHPTTTSAQERPWVRTKAQLEGAWRRARTHGCPPPRSERPLLLQPLWGPRLLPGQQRVPQLHL